MRFRLTVLLSLSVAGLALAGPLGCDREKKDEAIQAYDAPKDSPKADRPVAVDGSAQPAPQSAGGEIAWTLPQGWKQLAGTGMRYASIAVSQEDPELQISVMSTVGSQAQDVLANVNRWRNEFKLPPVSEGELDKQLVHIDAPGGHIDVLDLTGPAAADGKPQLRMLAALLPHGKQAWSFKLVGPAEKVGAQKERFGAFLKSVHFAAGAAATAEAPTKSGEPLDLGGATVRVPADWQVDPTPRQMRVATLLAGPATAQVELVITRFPAETFNENVESNINRWRREVGLGESAQPRQDHVARQIQIPGAQGVVFDMANEQSDRRLLVALVQGDANTIWFLKLIGPAGTVNTERENFDAFVRSIRFGQ